MEPILKLIRMANIGKRANQKLADEALRQYERIHPRLLQKKMQEIEDNNEAMKKVAEFLSEVINSKNLDNSNQYFGDSFLLKLLNSYYPNEYFPINSEKMIDNALKIFKVNYQTASAKYSSEKKK